MLLVIAQVLQLLILLQASTISGTELEGLFLDLSDAYCTERCHVNSVSYRNDFNGEVFQHATHSAEKGFKWSFLDGSNSGGSNPLNQTSVERLHCVDCHKDVEVNKEGHGRLVIDKEDCLRCHHVDNRYVSCGRCHREIDIKSMEYGNQPFVHGFRVDSDIDCRQCHLPDAGSSIREGVNCEGCHHTRPNIGCQGCHEEALRRAYYPKVAEMNRLGWTAGFLHSQHPPAILSCQECHPPRGDRSKGVGEYQNHCGECHHKKEADCQRCHRVVFDFFRGRPLISGAPPVPDKMSRVVKCEDCHRPLEGGGGFSEVRQECARCHNEHYAELLEAQKGVLSGWVDSLKKALALLYPLSLFQRLEGSHPETNFEEWAVGSGFNQGGLIELVERYGLHNFSYSKAILSLLDEASDVRTKGGSP